MGFTPGIQSYFNIKKSKNEKNYNYHCRCIKNIWQNLASLHVMKDSAKYGLTGTFNTW